MSYLSFFDTAGSVKASLEMIGVGDVKALGNAAAGIAVNVKDALRTSLPQFVKPSLIESPNFMQASLAEEPIVNDILKNLYNVYIGYILCALQMDNFVVGNRRVRDILSTVATESVDGYVDVQRLVEGLHAALEEFDPKSIIRRSGESRSDYDNRVEEARRQYNHDKSQLSNTTGSRYDAEKSAKVPIVSGRQVEISFAAGPDREPVTITLNVRFNTRLIPENVVEFILSQNITSDVYSRWLQYRAGEIRFFKDFVFGVDKASRKAEALKADKGNTLADMFIHKNKSMFKRMLRLANKSNSHNIANSILMLDESTATYYCKKFGFNFDNLLDRKRFFENTYSLFIVLVDSRYSRVTIYTNGIDQSASYSFNELKASAASDKMSLADIMEYLSKSQMPKF